MKRQEGGTARAEIAARVLAERQEGELWATFADRIGVSPQIVSNWRNDGGPDVESILKIHGKTKWNLYWLLTGEGTKSAPPPSSDAFRAGVEAALKRIAATEAELRALATGGGGRPETPLAEAEEASREAERSLPPEPPEEPGERLGGGGGGGGG